MVMFFQRDMFNSCFLPPVMIGGVIRCCRAFVLLFNVAEVCVEAEAAHLPRCRIVLLFVCDGQSLGVDSFPMLSMR